MYSLQFWRQGKNLLILWLICAEQLVPVEICGNQVKNLPITHGSNLDAIAESLF
jgi:hypothetical protein